MDNIVKKAGKRVYRLYQLKRAGVKQADLVTINISVVRPVVEYACPVWSFFFSSHYTTPAQCWAQDLARG